MARSRRLRPTYIRQWRESRGLTLEQSEAIGVTRPTLSCIENGKVAYTEERLERIADELQAHQAAIPLDYATFSISSIWAPSGASMKATW